MENIILTDAGQEVIVDTNESLNELQVVIKTAENVEVLTNFDALKIRIAQELKKIENTPYSDKAEEQITQWKEDKKSFVNMKKIIGENFKSFKDAYNIPLEKTKKEVEELYAIIDIPHDAIVEKINDFSGKEREKKKILIRNFYDTLTEKVEDEFIETLYEKIYNESWSNPSTTQKAYKEGLSLAVTNFVSGIATINMMDSEFKGKGLELFKETLDLNQALNYMNRKKAEKEAYLLQERERVAAEKAREQELAEQRIKEEQLRNARMLAEQEAKQQKAIEDIRKENEAKLELEKQKFQQEVQREKELLQKQVEIKVKEQVTEAKEILVGTTVSEIQPMKESNTQKKPLGVSDIRFNLVAWKRVKEFCDQNGIAYMEIK